MFRSDTDQTKPEDLDSSVKVTGFQLDPVS